MNHKIDPYVLLRRKEVVLDTPNIDRFIKAKTLLITGAGGTIGGELARQVIQYRPSKVILLDNHATSLISCELALKDLSYAGKIVSILGDLRDKPLMKRMFSTHRPQLVFHAAAHKHLSQLEFNVHEGISNNLVGTYHLADIARQFGVEVFAFVSTDKAVYPACVMGATKRAGEQIMSTFAETSDTTFLSVRFGNVLGSSGSVLQILQKQIDEGKPLTVTDPKATRFFMTVQEAAGLILQAAFMAEGGEIFILKMGEPIRIEDLARRLLSVNGLVPNKDVPIHFTGLKPGEKLQEELVEETEEKQWSVHSSIWVVYPKNLPVDTLSFQISELERLCVDGSTGALLNTLHQLVPTFTTGSAKKKLPAYSH